VAIAVVVCGLGARLPGGRLLALAVPTIFVGLGIYGGLERQDYFLGYWRRNQAELRSIVEQVPGLKPDAYILLYVPSDAPYLATTPFYKAFASLAYMYGDPSLAPRVILWDDSCTTTPDAVVCGGPGTPGCIDSGRCAPGPLPFAQTVILTYSPAHNRYLLEDKVPARISRGLPASPAVYRPHDLIVDRALPPRTKGWLYGRQFLGTWVPGEPSLDLPTLLAVDDALHDNVEPDPQFHMPPWGSERVGMRRVLWLGRGRTKGFGLRLWSRTRQPVTIACDVAPGPARPDNSRTLRMTLHNRQGSHVFERRATGPRRLAVDVVLEAGPNDWHLAVQDRVTVTLQPNGDTRPLLVLLTGVHVFARDDQPGTSPLR
jgi:hypothetical protein